MIYSQKSGIIYTRNSERNSDELPHRTANIFLSAVKLSGGRGMKQRTYIAIDLKSFYASVECMERKLDPMTTNLVVADESRTQKTIGLAVSPSLKSFGIPGRPRLFEVVQKVKEVNNERRRKAGGKLEGESYNINELNTNPSLAVSYIVAPPQMASYMQYRTRIYQVYLKYFPY